MDTENKMKNALENVKTRLINIRAGRANPALLNGIMVSYYGTPTPIQSLANINAPEARQLLIKPFDRSCIKDIEKAINEANIGINPTNNGEMVILTIPELTEDRRKEYVKIARSIGEEGKVALRNIRQDAKDEIINAKYPEDEEKLFLEDLQELVEKYNKLIDEEIKNKESELMQI
ncbi:MAG: ribosome recycling factor [bacterium]|nr:ribosome recycling factor [bacterium]